jgi:hypothetical protein
MLHFRGHFDDHRSPALVKHEGSYAEVLRLMRDADPVKTEASLAQVTNKLKTDIRFVEITRNAVRVAKEVKPDIRLGVLAVCKAPILTHLDKILPKDMPFVDIESGSLWGARFTSSANGGRECAIMPRAVDDGSLAGLQTEQRDAIQSTEMAPEAPFRPCRGNEHNLKFCPRGCGMTN